jgi:hypothetical protein
MLRHCLGGFFVLLNFSECVVQAQTLYSDAGATAQYDCNNGSGNTNTCVEHHASTLQEGALRGEADWMRGYGEGMHSLAAGAVDAAMAREHTLRNQELELELYYQRKAMYKAYCDSRKYKSITSSNISLSAGQPSEEPTVPVTANGQINWPMALQAESNRPARLRLESYFARQFVSYPSGSDVKQYEAAHEAINELADDLKSRISTLVPVDYVAAKKFLKGLDDFARKTPALVCSSHN